MHSRDIPEWSVLHEGSIAGPQLYMQDEINALRKALIEAEAVVDAALHVVAVDKRVTCTAVDDAKAMERLDKALSNWEKA